MQRRTEIVVMVLLSAFGLLGTVFGLWALGASRGRPDLAGAQAFVTQSSDGLGQMELRDAAGRTLLSFGPAEVIVLDGDGRNIGRLIDVSQRHERTSRALHQGEQSLLDAQEAANRGDLELAERLLRRANDKLSEAKRAVGK